MIDKYVKGFLGKSVIYIIIGVCIATAFLILKKL